MQSCIVGRSFPPLSVRQISSTSASCCFCCGGAPSGSLFPFPSSTCESQENQCRSSKALSSLSVGDKIEVPVLSAYQSRFGAKIVFKVADMNHSGYPANSVTLIAEKIIQIMASDAKEPNNSDSNRAARRFPFLQSRKGFCNIDPFAVSSDSNSPLKRVLSSFDRIVRSSFGRSFPPL